MTYKMGIWIPIPGYEELYAFMVSNRIKGGQVLAFAKERKGINGSVIKYPERIKQHVTDEDGYLRTTLCRNGIQKTWGLHQISALIYLPNPENKPHVNHKFGVKTDNRPSQIEWATQSENEQHAHDFGLKRAIRGADNHLSIPIIQKTISGEIIKEWSSLGEIQRSLGFYKTNVARVAKGEWSQAYGFVWHFKK